MKNLEKQELMPDLLKVPVEIPASGSNFSISCLQSYGR